MNNVLTNSYIKLPNDIYDNLNVSNEELTILILMYRNYQQYKSIGLCSIQMICDYMRINISNNRKVINIIKDSISQLSNNGYIINIYNLYYDDCEGSINAIIKDKDTLFYVELTPPPTERYFEIYDKNINYIFEKLASKNLNKFNLVRYYIACVRVSHNDSNFGYLSQTKLKQLISDSRTIQRYNKVLQDDLHLILYNNNYLTPEKHYCTTFIGKYGDEDNFNKQVEIEVSMKGLVHTDKIKSNVKRSVKQEINHLLDDKDIKIKELEEKLKQYEELQFKEKKKK